VDEPELLYLDASALVKLVWREPETDALVAALAASAKLVASEIAEVEVLRALRRRGGKAAAELGRAKLESVRLLPVSLQIRQGACDLHPAELRSLDAIHIATALQLGDLLACVYAYDMHLIEAARRVGLRVLAPSEDDPEGTGASEPRTDRLRPANATDNPNTESHR
jgi:predicted nucleic acid-binding protein